VLSVITHTLWDIQSSLSVSLKLLTYMCSVCELGDVTGLSSEDLVQLNECQETVLFGKKSRATFAKNSRTGSSHHSD